MKNKLDPTTTDAMMIRAPNWVGDVVMAVPFYKCIRDNFPQATLYGCIRAYAAKILAGNPWFDGMISTDDKAVSGFLRLASDIRAARIQTAFILPRSTRSLLTARLGGVKRVYSWRQDGHGLLVTGGPAHPKAGPAFTPTPMGKHYLKLAQWLDLPRPESTRPELFITDAEQSFADDLLKKYGISDTEPVIGLNPGAQFGSSKCWPPNYFARLAELLQDRLNCRLLIFAGPGEDTIAEAIASASRAEIINTAGDRVDLAGLKPMINRCDLLVTNDTGPRHYAVAFDVPVVVIMGSTDPAYTNDNLEKTVVVRKELACSPCHLTTCPEAHECMTTITPEEVLEAAVRLWEKEKP
jgi:heptosyltransferase II